MTLDEGYIKYDSAWTRSEPTHEREAAMLERWRQPLFAAGLVGVYADEGVGYGNISLRLPIHGQFLISGTQTGHLEITTAAHYAVVTHYDIDANRVACCGPVQASSESLTHAALYELDPEIGAIVHVHSRLLWDQLRDVLPTTRPDVAYGTPGMAREFRRLYEDTGFAAGGIAVMAGHDEGIVSIGTTLEQAARRVLALAAC